MLGGADNPNGELLSYIIGADMARGSIPERYVQSMFTATSQTCSWTVEVRALNPKCLVCAGRSIQLDEHLPVLN